MISLENITKRYQSGKIKVRALNNITLRIGKGEFVMLSGPSGSGKTTLLNIIGCLIRISSGRLWLDNQEISHFPDHFLSQIRRERIGFIFQQFNLLPGYRTWENVSLVLSVMGIPDRIRREKAMNILRELNLETRADFMANELSGGEQQRAAIARALINDPDIILADEPLSNIDSGHIRLVVDILADLKKRGKTIITTSHDEQQYMADLVDEKYYFQSGEICSSSTEEGEIGANE